MSTLKVTNIQATGETASRAVSGVAAAWVNFNGTGTPAIRDSENVSSITDNGTGDYTVTYSNNFSAADYGFAACNNNFSGGDNWTMALKGSSGTESAPQLFSTSQSRMSVTLASSQFADVNMGSALYFGDLA